MSYLLACSLSFWAGFIVGMKHRARIIRLRAERAAMQEMNGGGEVRAMSDNTAGDGDHKTRHDHKTGPEK